GPISITASNLSVLGGSTVTGEVSGSGTGGDITIRLSGGLVVSGTDGSAASQISSNSRGITDVDFVPGDAGNILIDAETVKLTDGGTITTTAADAAGGNIALNVGNLLYLQDSSITTSVLGGTGNGGNINIDPKILVLDHSVISANAVEGHG